MGTRLRQIALALMLLLVLGGNADAAKNHTTETELSSTVRAAETAGVPAATVNRLLTHGYEQNWDTADTGRLLRGLIAAQQSGFPLQPFVSKIEEGLAKRIPPSKIAQVLERKEDDYRFTQTLLADRAPRPAQHQTSVSTEERVRLTELLNAGLQREELKQLFADAPATPLPVLIRGAELLASLRQTRFDTRLTTQIVSLGLKQNYFTASQADLGRIIAAAKNRGMSDKDIAAAALSAIQDHASTDQLASRLGLSPADLGARGPQLGGSRSGVAPEGMSSGAGQAPSSSSTPGSGRGGSGGGSGGSRDGGGGSGGRGGSGGGGRR